MVLFWNLNYLFNKNFIVKNLWMNWNILILRKLRKTWLEFQLTLISWKSILKYFRKLNEIKRGKNKVHTQHKCPKDNVYLWNNSECFSYLFIFQIIHFSMLIHKVFIELLTRLNSHILGFGWQFTIMRVWIVSTHKYSNL